MSIITLNANRLNAVAKIHRLTGEYKNKTVYIVYRNPYQTQGHLQTENKGMEVGIPHKWKSRKLEYQHLYYSK